MKTKCKPNKPLTRSKLFSKLRTELKDTITEALKLGNLSIMPPRNDGSKIQFPKKWKSFQKEIATEKQLADWYKNGLTGFGLVCGAVSGNLECLDLDSHKVFERFCIRMKKFGQAKLLKRLQMGYYERTPNGVHFLYRCSEISGSSKLATKPRKKDKNGTIKIITLIETKGEGGLIICAPSYGGVNRDGEYKLISGGLSTIPQLSPSEREDLHTVARTFHIEEEEKINSEVARNQQVTQSNAGRPGDDFNKKANWTDILIGWTTVDTRNGVTYLRRPGKVESVSATLNYQGKDLFRNYSTSTPFELKYYDKFGAYAALHHNGDFSAAAKQLILDGYGWQGDNVKNEEDEAVKELALSCFPEVQFPLAVLPDYFLKLVDAYSKALQCSPAFVAMNFMTVVSGAAGNAVTLKLKESWKTSPFLWLGIIDVTGAGKSHPIEAAMKPLLKLQAIEELMSSKEVSDE